MVLPLFLLQKHVRCTNTSVSNEKGDGMAQDGEMIINNRWIIIYIYHTNSTENMAPL